MTTKILAGIAAAVLVTLIGVYASTGSIPGLSAVTDAAGLTTSEGGSCCSKCTATSSETAASCSVEATECAAATCPVSSDALGACAGSMTISSTTEVTKKKVCCEE